MTVRARATISNVAPFDPSMVLNSAGGDTAELLIHGQIGRSWWDDESVSAKQVARALAGLPKNTKQINVGINSFGGSLADGFAIYNALKAHSAKIVVTVDGVAMSAASLIAMAGDEVRVPGTSIMMIHSPSCGAHGNAVALRRAAAVLDKFSDAMVSAYTSKSGKSESDIKALLDGQDHFYTGAEAVAAGFADTLIDDSTGATAFLSPASRETPWANQVSAAFRAGLAPVASVPAPLPEVVPVAESQTPPTEPVAVIPAGPSAEVTALSAQVEAAKVAQAEVQAAYQAAQAEIAEIKAKHDAMVEASADAAAVLAAQSSFKHLPVKAEDLGPCLRRLRKLDAAACDLIEATLKSVDVVAAQALAPVGKSTPANTGGVRAQIDGMVKAKRDADPKLSVEKAESLVLAENPNLYTALRAEEV